jgi:hypothetical protein
MATATNAATDADYLAELVFNDRDLAILRRKAEEIRVKNHSGAPYLGANHYMEALVDLGWSNEFVVRVAALLKAARHSKAA